MPDRMIAPESNARQKLFAAISSFVFVVAVLVPGGRMTCPASTMNAQSDLWLSRFTAQDVPVLVTGVPVAREIAPGETHTWRITLAAGQYLYVSVVQSGVAVKAGITAPDDSQILTVSTAQRLHETEQLHLIADEAGEYQLIIEAVSQQITRGRYEVKIEALRVATEQDVLRVAAERAFAEGTRLRLENAVASRRSAITKYQEAATLFQSVEAEARAASAFNNLGYVHQMLREPEQALAAYQQALSLSRAAHDVKTEAITLLNLAALLRQKGQHPQALTTYQQALSVSRKAGDPAREAAVLNNLASFHYQSGETQQALQCFEQATAIFRSLGDRRSEATSLNNLGVIQRLLGHTRKALESYTQSLTISRALADQQAEADTLSNLGTIYQMLGEPQKVLECHTQALAIFQASGNRQREALALNNLGYAYARLGEGQQARRYYDQSLQLARALDNNYIAATVLGNLGILAATAGEYQSAITNYQQALALKRALKDRRGEAQTAGNLGVAYEKLGELEQALTWHQQALAQLQAVGPRTDEAATLHNLGRTYERMGKVAAALDHYHRALALKQSIGDRQGEGETLLALAQVTGRQGNLAEAVQHAEAAIEIAESVRASVNSQELRTTYFASRQGYYETCIDLLMQQHQRKPAAGYDVRALQIGERARARSLLEILTQARADIYQGVAATLLARKRELQQQIDASESYRTQLLRQGAGKNRIDKTRQELATLLTQYQQVQTQIQAASPRYAALTQPAPLSLAEIQQQILDDDTLLLEYALGDERSYLWAVTKTGLASFALPERATIEAAARQVYALLTARNQRLSSETQQQRQRRIAQSDTAFLSAATELSRMLIGPIADRLPGKRLLVIPDGALQYIPFAVLPEPVIGDQLSVAGEEKRQSPATSHQPLIASHEIINLPSASVLAVMRRERVAHKPAARTLAILADPVFQMDDPRVATSAHKRNAQPQELLASASLTRAASETGLRQFSRLRFTRLEAERITSLLPAHEYLRALDFSASQEILRRPDLDQFRIIHFATHGLLNNRNPEFSGLVLSLVNEAGAPQDGFLRLHEIYNLKLNAELVVLSGCRTALGRELRGEGLIGLTRGFMYAGAARVMASLWSIDDRATAELMKRMYEGMLREGLRPAAALHKAQREMARTKAPYYWAAFTLQGEWR